MRDYTDQVIMLNAAAANVVGIANMASFWHVELQLAQVGFTGTIKFVGSNADAPPDFSAAASAANPWDFIQVVDQKDASAIAGGTGIASTAVTAVRNFEANTNAMKWVGAIISNYSAGSVTLKGKGVSDI